MVETVGDYEDGGRYRVRHENRESQLEGVTVTIVKGDGETAPLARLAGLESEVKGDGGVPMTSHPIQMTF